MALFLYTRGKTLDIFYECEICNEHKISFLICNVCKNSVCTDCAKSYYLIFKNPSICMFCCEKININPILPWCKWCKNFFKF